MNTFNLLLSFYYSNLEDCIAIDNSRTDANCVFERFNQDERNFEAERAKEDSNADSKAPTDYDNVSTDVAH